MCGLLGPLALSPDDNHPLVGALIAGPGGAALGLGSGLLARRLPLQPGARWELLGASCLILAASVLFASMPEPKLCGEIIDAEVRGCTPPGGVDAAQPAASDSGVVLELHVLRRRGIYENQRPWNRGKLLAREWQPDDQTRAYVARFAGDSCEGYTGQSRGIFSPTRDSGILRPVPEEYLRFAGP